VTAVTATQNRMAPIAALKPTTRHPLRDVVAHAAALLVLATWAFPLTHGTGGRDQRGLLLFAVAVLIALPALRAWRVGVPGLGLAATTATAALLVCVTAPTRWWGADVAAGYVTAAAAFIAARAYVTTAQRRLFILAGVALGGMLQFSDAFLPWWGSRNSTSEMSGTFFWHNPYAAFLLPGALLGAAFVVSGHQTARWIGWVAAPACAAGIVFSSSRASLAVLVVAWIALAVVLVRSRTTARRLAAITVLSAAVVLALPGPPFFGHWRSPFAAANARADAGETLSQNGFYRTEFWREAVEVAEHHPVAGAGFHSLATAGTLYTPVGWARSPFAHNGYLQALTDGGLLLGVPFLLAVAVAGWCAARRFFTAAWSRGSPRSPVTAASAVVVLALMAHSAVDFDWSYPSILVELALLAACLPRHTPRTGDAGDGVKASLPKPPLAAVALVALAGGLVVSILSLHAWQRSARGINETLAASTRLAAADAVFGDFRPAQSVLQSALSMPAAVSDAQAQRALALTAAPARVDLHLWLLRDAVLAQRGQGARAVADAHRALSHVHGDPAPYTYDLARVLGQAGDRAGTTRLLEADLRGQVTRGAAPSAPQELILLAQVASPSDYACLYAALTSTLPPGSSWSSPVPTPAATCRPAG
jgi:O-antigen ligase